MVLFFLSSFELSNYCYDQVLVISSYYYAFVDDNMVAASIQESKKHVLVEQDPAVGNSNGSMPLQTKLKSTCVVVSFSCSNHSKYEYDNNNMCNEQSMN